VELVAPDRLDPVKTASAGDVLAIAAHVGATRLIDNIILGEAA
jgi:pantothenate synthetase